MSTVAREPHAAAEALAGVLYERYGARIQRFCRAQLRSREDAEDAVQTTFLKAFSALQAGVVPEYEAPWLFKIAHNVCLSRRLAAVRRGRVERPEDLQALQDELPATIDGSGSEELIGLEAALAEMPENQRRAILLREWQGLSYHEIADELGLSHSAVETLLFRARRHLAQALERGVKRPVRRAGELASALGGLRSLLGLGGAAKVAATAVVVAGVAVASPPVRHVLFDRHAARPVPPAHVARAPALLQAPALPVVSAPKPVAARPKAAQLHRRPAPQVRRANAHRPLPPAGGTPKHAAAPAAPTAPPAVHASAPTAPPAVRASAPAPVRAARHTSAPAAPTRAPALPVPARAAPAPPHPGPVAAVPPAPTRAAPPRPGPAPTAPPAQAAPKAGPPPPAPAPAPAPAAAAAIRPPAVRTTERKHVLAAERKHVLAATTARASQTVHDVTKVASSAPRKLARKATDAAVHAAAVATSAAGQVASAATGAAGQAATAATAAGAAVTGAAAAAAQAATTATDTAAPVTTAAAPVTTAVAPVTTAVPVTTVVAPATTAVSDATSTLTSSAGEQTPAPAPPVSPTQTPSAAAPQGQAAADPATAAAAEPGPPAPPLPQPPSVRTP